MCVRAVVRAFVHACMRAFEQASERTTLCAWCVRAGACARACVREQQQGGGGGGRGGATARKRKSEREHERVRESQSARMSGSMDCSARHRVAANLEVTGAVPRNQAGRIRQSRRGTVFILAGISLDRTNQEQQRADEHRGVHHDESVSPFCVELFEKVVFRHINLIFEKKAEPPTCFPAKVPPLGGARAATSRGSDSRSTEG